MPVLPLGFQIALGQFLIEIVLKVLGEDIASLCGDSPTSHDKSKEAACTVNNGIGTREKKQAGGCPGEMLSGHCWGSRAHPQGTGSKGWRTGQGGFTLS